MAEELEAENAVGPTDQVVTELSSFMGTLARNATLCRYDIFDWRKMDTTSESNLPLKVVCFHFLSFSSFCHNCLSKFLPFKFSEIWQPPTRDGFKCNTDGACRGNPGLSSYGFCVRDFMGDLVYAEAAQIGETTNMESEVVAVLKALTYCESKAILGLTLESDSLSLIQCIKGTWKVPWEQAQKIEECRGMVERLQVNISHTLREGNILADFIANMAFESQDTVFINSFQQLPPLGRRILNLEKQKVPNLRIRTRPINTEQ